VFTVKTLALFALIAACNPGTETLCEDTLDNDADGFVDCDDQDCAGDAACTEGDTDTDADSDTDTDTDTDTDVPLDDDEDGYVSIDDGGDDCDDGDASINPGADEYCNGVDDDCDDETDEAESVDASTWYADTDTDGFGDAGDSATACEAPTGMVSDATDCDDAEATTYPDADELVADGIDQDCDSVETCYEDTDGDGYGATTTVLSEDLDCDDAGEASSNADLDDSDGSTYPGAPEIPGDGIDQDGDGGDTCYVDDDGDSYGTTTTVASVDLDCEDSGESALTTDCDDAEASTYPGADEYCDGHDDDCDGDTDEDDAVDASTWYADTDGDLHGDPLSTDRACTQPSGYAADATDCDDGDASINPSATEATADGMDQDCDGGDLCYEDADGDSYGSTATVASADMDCSGSGESTDASDCDDAEATTHPSADEYCDGHDNDCDGDTDESSAVDASTWYADADGDLYGDPLSTDRACTQPSGYVTDPTDCNDTNGAINPGETETVADGIDQDCDSGDTCYVDSDGDGYGTTTTVVSTDMDCSDAGESTANTDFDDSEPTAYPGASEVVADGIDQDGDGTEVCYEDLDGDGYGTSATVASSDLDCDDEEESTESSDLDDSDGTTYPGAPEIPGDGIDQDGDGTESCYVDADGDGYGTTTTVASTDMDCTDSGESALDTDCDDGEATTHPGADEYCDGIDDDCDGDVGEDHSIDASTWFADVDGDLYGDPLSTDRSCDQPSGYVADDTDCDDSDAAVSPLEEEVCADGIDQDCDGLDTRCLATGTIDLGTTYDARLEAESSGDGVGVYVAFAGDVDEDGGEDILVGATDAYTGSVGAVYLVAGDVSGSWPLSDRIAAIYGAPAGAQLWKGANVGDMDSDGHDDFIFGDTIDSTVNVDGGAAYLFYGPLSGDYIATDADAWFSGATSEMVGYTLAGGSDLDNDGVSDFAVGTYHYSGSSPGDLYLFSGTAAGSKSTGAISGMADLTISGSFGGDYLGGNVSMDDITGDGLDDLIVGAWAEDSLYVFSGPMTLSGSLVSADADVELTGAMCTGFASESAGDTNADGYNDLIVGAYYYTTGAGAAYLQLGPVTSADLTTSADAFFYTGGTYFGYHVSSGGDMDQDGYDEVAVGALYADGLAGTVHLWRGPLSGSQDDSTAAAIYEGEHPAAAVSAVAGGRDLDGDGFTDLLIGSHGWDSGSGYQDGCVYVLFGGAF